MKEFEEKYNYLKYDDYFTLALSLLDCKTNPNLEEFDVLQIYPSNNGIDVFIFNLKTMEKRLILDYKTVNYTFAGAYTKVTTPNDFVLLKFDNFCRLEYIENSSLKIIKKLMNKGVN